jgi:peroxiredoxin
MSVTARPTYLNSLEFAMHHPLPYPTRQPVGLTRRQLLVGSPALLLPLAGWAQPGGAALGEKPELQGRVPGGPLMSLGALQGQVVLVFYWSTTCAVCRDKMGELRANLAGWKGQAFTVLGVNMDKQLRDFMAYEELVTQTVPANRQFVSIAGQGPEFRDTMGPPAQLPSANLIDKQGRLVERYTGRIPAATWDRIADLL